MRLFNTSEKLIKSNKFKIGFSCSDSYKKIFHESKCLLPVSVGQSVHEGDRFAETIQSVDEKFRSWTLLIDDTLQRHTLMINSEMSENEAYKLSKILGDEWIERNFNCLSRLFGNSNAHKKIEMIRWDYWAHHKKYEFHHGIIKDEYENNIEYQTSIDNTVDEFIRRYKNRLPDFHLFNESRAQKLCRDYLFEECTALCLWTEGKYQFEAYPGPRNEAMSKTHSLFIAPKNPNMLNPIRIRFKSKKGNFNEESHENKSEVEINSCHPEDDHLVTSFNTGILL